MRLSTGALALSIADQAALSLFALGLNLVLIRHTDPTTFGLFAFVQTTLLILTSVQNALIVTPIGVEAPGRPAAVQEQVIGRLVAVDRLLRIAALPLAAGVSMLAAIDVVLAAGSALYVFAGLWRETQRGVSFALLEPVRVLWLDLAAIAVSIAMVAMLWALGAAPIHAVVYGMATGFLAGALVGRRRHVWWSPGAALAAYRSTFVESRWTLVGASTTEAQNRGYVFAVEGLRDAAALGSIQAGRVLMGPLTLVAHAWGRVARPSMNAALFQGDIARARATLWTGCAVLTGIVGLYLAVIWAAWPVIDAALYRGRYPDIGWVTFAWALVTALAVIQAGIAYYLQAARQFRTLAMAGTVGAAISLAGLVVLAAAVPPVYAVYAVLAGEIVVFTMLLVAVFRPAPVREDGLAVQGDGA